MGKKKRQAQNSNSALSVADSSESESSKDSVPASEASKPICPHISRSVEISNLRKNIKTTTDKTACQLCKKESTPCKDGWVCLRCGSCNCGPDEENHRVNHFKTPRSDSHLLAMQINTNIIWCFQCEKEIPTDINKKVQGCADFIKKQYSRCLTYSPVRVDTGNKIVNGGDSTAGYMKQDQQLCQPLQNICLNKNVTKPTLNLPKVRGLANLGNTCFFNSVLQCLAQTPGLVALLREMDVPGEKFHIELDGITIDTVLEKHKTSQLSEQLAQILEEISGANQTGDGKGGQYTVNPRGLLAALTSKCPQFEGGDQHDAHELLRHLLDSVHIEDLRRYQKAILAHIGFSKTLDEVEEEKKKFGKKLNQKVCETIPIRPDQIFKGSLVSILQCTVCQHESKREEPFLDLSLPVAQEKAQPPSRKKPNCNSPVDEEKNTETTMSKHQSKKEKRMAKKNLKRNKNNKNLAQGEPTIEEEDKKDSLNGEQSDADVEDNEDNACEEQDQKTEVVESGYSSEKQMSARGSPITAQTPEEESKYDFKPGASDCPAIQVYDNSPEHSKPASALPLYPASFPENSETLLANSAESGLGSIQCLTVVIPEETNVECTSQDSIRVNASNNSPDISSDSQQGNLKSPPSTENYDLSPEYKLPPSSDSQLNRTDMINNWNCSGDVKAASQESSSVSLSVSPHCGSQSSAKGSPDNMSICTSLPENTSMLINSPSKNLHSQREDNSESEERPESRMECRKNRSSPVELGEPTELDSGLLKLSLEGMTCAADSDAAEEASAESPVKPATVANEEWSLMGGVAVKKSPTPVPPPLPLFSSPYSFSHPEPTAQRFNSSFTKHKMEEGEYSLQSCLNQFTTMEMLTAGNKVGCDACTERYNKGNKEGKTVYQISTKQLLISKLPPVVIFHLKRFQVQRCSFRKISRHVDFPLVLDISPYCCLSEGREDEPILYSLYGVVEHSGTLYGGHYVAYVKVRSQEDRRPGLPPPGKWYYISDSRVSDVDESAVLNTQAYLLFYERIL